MTDGADRPIEARPQLERRLGTADAVVMGLGSMVGAGIFAVLAPAAAAAGTSLLIGLAAAAVVAYLNATSSARCAARYPESGGAYVYGRKRLGEFWGYLAGWGFIVGKTASCAATALIVGFYAWPAHAHAIAVVAVLALTALNCTGIQKSALATRIIVAVVLAALAAVSVVALTAPRTDFGRLDVGADASAHGVLQGAGLLFFAFAGYARIATLGEEVRDPARTIPRAIRLALGIALIVYAVVATAALAVLGSEGLAASAAPLADVVRAAGAAGFAPVVRIVAVMAALGSLLSLILGVLAPHSRWRVITIYHSSFQLCIRNSRRPTARRSWSASWSRFWPEPPTCAVPLGSRHLRSWCTTRSPTPRRGRSAAGSSQRSDSSAV